MSTGIYGCSGVVLGWVLAIELDQTYQDQLEWLSVACKLSIEGHVVTPLVPWGSLPSENGWGLLADVDSHVCRLLAVGVLVLLVCIPYALAFA